MRCLIQYKPSHQATQWLDFSAPHTVIEAISADEVMPALSAVEHAVNEGRCAAGFMNYEAAPGLDAALVTHSLEKKPLLRFGIYDFPTIHTSWPMGEKPFSIGAFKPTITEERYRDAVNAIKEWIAQGDTYQVNFTFRLRAPFEGDPATWFNALVAAQQPRYAAWIDDGPDVYCSVSPELFFELDHHRLTTRPMKGTAGRGLSYEQDTALGADLKQSIKNRAENVMIVDMMRNDLSRLATPGSVRVASLFDLERYPTVWQLTSTVHAETQSGFAEVMRALFPSCSITGAPKVRTMQIIKQLEREPRGIYTGSIGFLMPQHPSTRKPGRFAQFNVAIRTAHIQRDSGLAEYGTGGGIVWDSGIEKEYKESLVKSLVLRPAPRPFALFETMCWKPGQGIWLWREHTERLRHSATYFGYPYQEDTAKETVQQVIDPDMRQRKRVRLLLHPDGSFKAEIESFTARRSTWKVALNDKPIDEGNVFLYHKTTHRDVYETAQARFPEANDVLLWNSRGEITETCFANVAIRLKGIWYTPPITCGLLNGTLRNALVRRGRLHERIIHTTDLPHAERILLINSLRGFIPAMLLPPRT